MNTILIIAALIQLIVIIVVVYAIHIPEHTHPLIPVELSLQEQQ